MLLVRKVQKEMPKMLNLELTPSDHDSRLALTGLVACIFRVLAHQGRCNQEIGGMLSHNSRKGLL